MLAMELHQIGLTLTTFGEVLIAYIVITVHHHIARERRIDEDVINQMKKERVLGIMGIGCIIVGYVIQLTN